MLRWENYCGLVGNDENGGYNIKVYCFSEVNWIDCLCWGEVFNEDEVKVLLVVYLENGI